MIRPLIHLLLHFLVPAAVARFWLKERWISGWSIMVMTLVIDLDHLWASPVYNPMRCSIGTHPLHSPEAVLVYLLMGLVPPLRIAAAGLLIHIGLDGIDCLFIRLS